MYPSHYVDIGATIDKKVQANAVRSCLATRVFSSCFPLFVQAHKSQYPDVQSLTAFTKYSACWMLSVPSLPHFV